MPHKLGILAGGGLLPVLIDERCMYAGRPRFTVVLKGHGNPTDFSGSPHTVNRLGAAGRTLDILRQEGCTDIVLAGAIRRPGVLQMLPDWWAIKLLLRTGAGGLGDDGMLRALIRAIEEEGFRIVGADELLPDLLAPAGVLGSIRPTAADEADIAVAVAAARALGRNDTGQAAVAAGGAVLALEDKAGTDTMLLRLADEGRGKDRGVLAKMMKPGQERRADLPTIGPDTVEHAHAAGLAGIAVEAGHAFILSREETTKLADALGLFIVGVTP